MKMMAKRALKSVVLQLPWGAREAIFEALCTRAGASEVLARVAKQAGFTGFNAPGRWGIIQSASTDQSILPAYARTGDWARRTHEVFESFYSKDGGTYLDIGANIGLTTLPVARNPAVNCFAFEPDPTNFLNLQENVRRNAKHDNVTLFQLALFDKHATVEFGLAEDGNLGDHRIVTAGNQRRTIAVKAAPLDALGITIKGRLGVKIDTQGAEPAIIAGGKATLAKADLVVMEFSPCLINELRGDPDVIIEYLAGFDRIALTAGESEADLVYQSPETACAELKRTFQSARFDDTVYLDVYAERDQARLG